MHFVPLVVGLCIVATDAVYPDPGPHRGRRKRSRIHDLAYDKGAWPVEAINEPERQVSILAIDAYIGHIALREDMGVVASLNVINRDRMKALGVKSKTGWQTAVVDMLRTAVHH